MALLDQGVCNGSHQCLHLALPVAPQRGFQVLHVHIIDPKDVFHHLPPQITALGQRRRNRRQMIQRLAPERHKPGPQRGIA